MATGTISYDRATLSLSLSNGMTVAGADVTLHLPAIARIEYVPDAMTFTAPGSPATAPRAT